MERIRKFLFSFSGKAENRGLQRTASENGAITRNYKNKLNSSESSNKGGFFRSFSFRKSKKPQKTNPRSHHHSESSLPHDNVTGRARLSTVLLESQLNLDANQEQVIDTNNQPESADQKLVDDSTEIYDANQPDYVDNSDNLQISFTSQNSNSNNNNNNNNTKNSSKIKDLTLINSDSFKNSKNITTVDSPSTSNSNQTTSLTEATDRGPLNLLKPGLNLDALSDTEASQLVSAILNSRNQTRNSRTKMANLPTTINNSNDIDNDNQNQENLNQNLTNDNKPNSLNSKSSTGPTKTDNATRTISGASSSGTTSNPEKTELPSLLGLSSSLPTQSEPKNQNQPPVTINSDIRFSLDEEVASNFITTLPELNSDDMNVFATNILVQDHLEQPTSTQEIEKEAETQTPTTEVQPSLSTNVGVQPESQEKANDEQPEEPQEETRLSYDGLEILKVLDNKGTIETEAIDHYIDKVFEKSFQKSLFFENATRTDAIKYLTDVENGGYCIRRKMERSRKPYVISVKIDDTSINHLWIRVCLHTVEKKEASSGNDDDDQKSAETEKPNDKSKSPPLSPATSKKSEEMLLNDDYDVVNETEEEQTPKIQPPPAGNNDQPVYETTDHDVSTDKAATSSSVQVPGVPTSDLTSDISEKKKKREKQADTEIRFGYHIDSGSKMFKSIFELLKFYEGTDLGTMFHKCGVTMKCVVDLENYKFDSQSGTYKDSDNKKAGTSSQPSPPTEVDGVLTFGNKKYKIINKNVKVAYDFIRTDYKHLEHDGNVFQKLLKGSLVQILEDEDQQAMDNNWLKCYSKQSEQVLYAPKNFVI